MASNKITKFRLANNQIYNVNDSSAVHFDNSQNLTEEQKQQVRENIGVVQPNWNQNDNTKPDYIKNRPFYEETETTPILESQQIDFSQSFRIPTSIVKGNTYLITWDGTDYTITATEKEIIAGEIYIPYLEQADGLFEIEGMTMRAADNGIHTVAISLVDSTTKTIDEKFIPNTIARDNKVVKHIFNIYPNEDGAINEISYDNLTNRPPIYHAYNGHGSVSLNTLYNHTDGDYSVAEGMSTIASSEYQHVQGKYNIEDSSNTYAHIVGNGTAITARSNAHTLDWSGNAWYAGKVSIGTTSNVPTPTDVNDLVTKQYVDNKFSTKTTSVTLAADSWTTSGNKFKYTYSNTSLRASVSPIITCTSNEKEYGYIADAEATANTGIVFTANKKPTSNIILTIIDIG